MFEVMADTQEEWYWHTLYFTDRQEAIRAVQYIKQHVDQCCDIRPATSQHAVEFSTNYSLSVTRQQHLREMIGATKGIETSFNQTEDDEEDLLNIFHWTVPEESSEVRTRITHGLCTLCGGRTPYGLWCAACKRAYLKSGVEFVDLPDVPDLCHFYNTSDRRSDTIENDFQYFIHIVRATLLGVIALPILLIGLLAGLVLWILEDLERRRS